LSQNFLFLFGLVAGILIRGFNGNLHHNSAALRDLLAIIDPFFGYQVELLYGWTKNKEAVE